MGLFNFWKKKEDPAPDADAVKKEIADLGLDAAGMDISVDGDKVKVGGKPISQEIKEKVIMAVGNLAGVASVEDDAEGGDPKFHEVQSGDTLWKISERALGDGSRYNEIFEANRPMLSDPDKIYPGQMLRIPQD